MLACTRQIQQMRTTEDPRRHEEPLGISRPRSWQSCHRSDPLPSLAQESLNQQLRHWPALRAHNSPHVQVLSRTLQYCCMTYKAQENNAAHCAVLLLLLLLL